LILALDFAIIFRVIGSSEASFDTKMSVESMHESGCKLGAAIREDFLWDSVKSENIPVVKLGSTLGR
jgi:hypothetical protein